MNHQVFRMDADDFARYEHGNTLVVIEIPRTCIEQMSVASTLEKLLVLTDSADNVRRYRESVAYSVSGYDHDPRELYEIPEVRAFFRALTAQWPHWFWFLMRGQCQIGMLICLLCDVERAYTSKGRIGTRLSQPADLDRVVRDLFGRGNALFDLYGITDGEASASAVSALAEIR